MSLNHSKQIINYFNSIYKNPKCTLNYKNNFQFLVAVSLSAQTTDNKVNCVSKKLFRIYKNPLELSKANINDVEKIIKSIGLAKNKSRYIVSMSDDLVNRYHSRVPNNIDDLLSLKGVGIKTANLVLSECFGAYTFPVDTHINRISKRLKIANNNDSIAIVEEKLKNYFPKYKWKKLHYQFISFGRDICKSKNPNCKICKLKTICEKGRCLNK